jgi:hypothetical protein
LLLRNTQAAPYRPLAWLAPLGMLAASALVLYGSFLGTEGQVYRWLRQYGTVVYFGFTCLCLLITSGALQRAAGCGVMAVSWPLRVATGALAVALVLLGLTNAIVAAVFGEPLKNRIENVTEWWGSLGLTLAFVVIAALWRRWGLRVRLAWPADAAR